MDSYEIVKTDQGHVMFVDGKFYSVPETAARMTKDELAVIFEGVKTKPVAGVVTRSDVTANILHAGDAPTIDKQPVAVAVQADGSATFLVEASGDEPLNYQWKRTGVDVKGANGPKLTLNGLQTSDN